MNKHSEKHEIFTGFRKENVVEAKLLVGAAFKDEGTSYYKIRLIRMCRRYGTFTCVSNKIKIAIVKAMQVEPGILLRVFLSGEADCATYYFLRHSVICWLPYSKSKMRSAQVFWASLNLRNR